MKERSQPKSLIEYGIEIFGWGLIVVHLYRTIAFKTIPGLNLTQSNWVFWGLWLFGIITGLLLTPKQHRGSISVFATINSPIAVYLILSFYKIYRIAFTIALTVIGLIAMIYLCLVLSVNLKDIWSGKYNGKLKRFIESFLHRIRMIVCWIGIDISSLLSKPFLWVAPYGSDHDRYRPQGKQPKNIRQY